MYLREGRPPSSAMAYYMILFIIYNFCSAFIGFLYPINGKCALFDTKY